jgi:hypothetical protein
MKIVYFMLLLTCCVAGCELGRSVQVPQTMLDCDELKNPEIKKQLADTSGASMPRKMLSAVCEQNGGGQFTGRLSCKNGQVEIRCR